MDTTSPGAGARDVRAQNGCGRPRDRRTEHTFAGRELQRRRLAAASAGGEARVGRWNEGPFGVCSVGLLRARPVSPLGYGMICPHDASYTMSADVLCHNPPIPCKGGMDFWLRPIRVSPPSAARLYPALFSKRTAQGKVSSHLSGGLRREKSKTCCIHVPRQEKANPLKPHIKVSLK